MYIPLIKETHPLIDLARYGTRSRKKIRPDVLIGAHPYPSIFKEGDILDANSTFNLVQNACDPEKIDEILSRFISEQKAELHRLEERVYRNQETTNQAFELVDTSLNLISENETQLTNDMNQIKSEIKDFVSVTMNTDEETLIMTHPGL